MGFTVETAHGISIGLGVFARSTSGQAG